MTDYFISRHEGAREFAKCHLPEAIISNMLDLDILRPRDRVYGILPIDLAAKVCAKGASFFALVFDRTGYARGSEMSVDEMVKRGAHLVPFHVAELSKQVR